VPTIVRTARQQVPPLDHRDTAAPALAACVTVVMPCLNEERTVGRCVAKALAAMRRAGITGEVVVADNGSSDGSIAAAEASGARVVVEIDRGYGAALRRGFLEARGEYVVMGDCDESYDFDDVARFVERLRGGADLVIGNRFAGGVLPGAMRTSTTGRVSGGETSSRWRGSSRLSSLGTFPRPKFGAGKSGAAGRAD
jgi:glycosyltransferase involved in cell wall biosynthesis